MSMVVSSNHIVSNDFMPRVAVWGGAHPPGRVNMARTMICGGSDRRIRSPKGCTGGAGACSGCKRCAKITEVRGKHRGALVV